MGEAQSWYILATCCQVKLRFCNLEIRAQNGKESTCEFIRCKRCRFNPWVGEIPWSRKIPWTEDSGRLWSIGSQEHRQLRNKWIFFHSQNYQQSHTLGDEEKQRTDIYGERGVRRWKRTYFRINVVFYKILQRYSTNAMIFNCAL